MESRIKFSFSDYRKPKNKALESIAQKKEEHQKKGYSSMRETLKKHHERLEKWKGEK